MRDRSDAYVLSDEVYKDLLYTGSHVSIAAMPGMQDRTIILDGLSKSYAMTGWRLGYGVFPQPLVDGVTKLAVNSVSCANAFSQMAMIAALEGPQDTVSAMREEFLKRRDVVVEGLRSIPGVTCPMPEGAFYAFPSIAGDGPVQRRVRNESPSGGGSRRALGQRLWRLRQRLRAAVLRQLNREHPEGD